MRQIDGIYSHFRKPTFKEKYGGVVRVAWVLTTGSGFFLSVGMFVGVSIY